ncbi:hypothetical protein D5R81_02520 [Parashewanella spongiae]|uniref:Protein kinase domain-containing protein n=1 Tax=Parashewanella spongiae TaxID=342950 RepID=A0A3A6UIY6_9GAMM|nr:serine/threonine-protein kinase [Parashewanella spongiae]MCL1078898.1 serine/threonine-protein kinase [Parashewanella spongiae]RJY19052.1 hypothetical protein D5R81_02520 [Parashewanella spongiae]
MASPEVFLSKQAFSSIDEASISQLHETKKATVSIKIGTFSNEKYLITIENNKLLGQYIGFFHDGKKLQLGDVVGKDSSDQKCYNFLLSLATHPSLSSDIAVTSISSQNVTVEEQILLLERAPNNVGKQVLNTLSDSEPQNKITVIQSALQQLSSQKAADILSQMDHEMRTRLLVTPYWNKLKRTKIIACLPVEQVKVVITEQPEFAKTLLSLESDNSVWQDIPENLQQQLAKLISQQNFPFTFEVFPRVPPNIAVKIASNFNIVELAKILIKTEKTVAAVVFQQLITNAQFQQIKEESSKPNDIDDWCVVESNTLGITPEFDSNTSKFNELELLLREFLIFDCDLNTTVFSPESKELLNYLDDQNLYWLVKQARGRSKLPLITLYFDKILKPPQIIKTTEIKKIIAIIDSNNHDFIDLVLCRLLPIQVIHLIRTLPERVACKMFSPLNSLKVFDECLIPAVIGEIDDDLLQQLREFTCSHHLELITIIMLGFKLKSCSLITATMSPCKQAELCKSMLAVLNVDGTTFQEYYDKCQKHLPCKMLATLIESGGDKHFNFNTLLTSHLLNPDIKNEIANCLNDRFWRQKFFEATEHNEQLMAQFLRLSLVKKKAISQLFTFSNWLEIAQELTDKDLLDFTDFEHPQKLSYWQTKYKDPTELEHIIRTVPSTEWSALLSHFTDYQLAAALFSLTIEIQAQFITAISTHSKATNILTILFFLSEGKTLELIHILFVKPAAIAEKLITLLWQIKTADQKGNSTLKKEIAYLLGELQDANKKAIIIQRNYKAHSTKLEEAKPMFRHINTPIGFVKLTNRGSTPGVEPIEYYYDKDKVFPPMRLPFHRLKKDEFAKLSGGFKKASAIDSQYISFDAEDTQESVQTDTSAMCGPVETDRNEIFKSKLKKVKAALGIKSWAQCSIQPGLQGIVVRKGKITAVFGGDDIINYREQLSPFMSLNYRVFNQFCYDMAKLHENHIFFRDIKPCNFLYKETVTNSKGRRYKLDSPQLSIIDLDDLFTGEPEDVSKECGTLNYSTKVLIELKCSGNPKILKSCDDYAAILTILDTSGDETVNLCLCPADYEDGANDTDYEDGANDTYEHGILDQENTDEYTKASIRTVLKRIIKENYLESVQQFLTDPVKNPLTASLHEIIDWTN